MLNRETAYKMAGRKHHAHAMVLRPKQRVIRLRAGQLERAQAVLAQLTDVQANPQSANALRVCYNLEQYTLEELEQCLLQNGVLLSASYFHKIQRAIIHFCEETQLRNQQAPERLIKKSNAAYMHSYDQHAHGDHDDTPKELREYK